MRKSMLAALVGFYYLLIVLPPVHCTQDVTLDDEISVLTEPSTINPSTVKLPKGLRENIVESSLHVIVLNTTPLKNARLKSIVIWINYKIGYVRFKIDAIRHNYVNEANYTTFNIVSKKKYMRGNITYNNNTGNTIIKITHEYRNIYRTIKYDNNYVSYIQKRSGLSYNNDANPRPRFDY